jgi:WD40 repeat protein
MMCRQALVVGVEGPAGSPADELPPKWQPLGYAAPYAQRLRDVLGKHYNYVLLDPAPDPTSTAAALGDALTRAVTGNADFTVIHLLAHGEPAENTLGLQAVGGDGEPTETLARWVEMAENRRADGGAEPAILLILDLCHSGAVTTEHLQSLRDRGRRRVWVLAACHSDQSAYDGRLSLAVDEVLRGFASGALKLDESQKYIPIDRFCREVVLSVDKQSAGSYPQTVEPPMAPVGADLSHLRFFPNPRYEPAALRSREGIDPAVFMLLDDVADSYHFVVRAQGAGSAFGVSGVPTFTGRSDELRELSTWLEGGGSSLRVITGVAGVGKSALVGILACAAHPALREATERVWRPSGGDLPGAVEGLAVVHARRRTLAEVLSSLATQWNLESPPRGRTWTTDQLVATLRTKAEPPYLIVDAVDEAEHPDDLVTALLLPLAWTQRADMKPLCRVLITTRPEEGLRHLLETAAGRDGLLDLDEVPAERLRRDLVNFVSRVLRPIGTGTSAWCSLRAAESLGRAMADTLLNGTREWGEFLVAGLYLRHLREQKTPPATTAEAAALGRDVPRTLGAILDLNLEFLASPGLRELMAALAWAEGSGMPERLLAYVAGLAPDVSGDEQPDSSELLQVLRFYIRRNVDRDGTPLYRLFHQGLADELRGRPVLDAVTVWDRLLATVPMGDARQRRWATAEPYLLRHAALHSVLAGRLGELLEDFEFLVHADPAPLADVLYHSEQSPRGAVYLTSYGAHHDVWPDERRSILAVDAARHQQWKLAAELSRETPWSIRWTAGRDLQTGLLATLIGHRGKIWDLATIQIRGRFHALSAGQDGTARLWDLDSATTTHELGDHGAAVGGVVAGEVDGAFLGVTGCDGGILRGWDLISGRCLWTRQAHKGPIWSMVTVRHEGVLAVASAGEDRVIRYWRLTTGEPLSTTPLSAINGPVWLLSRVAVDGLGDCVVACYDNWVQVLTVQGEEVDLPGTSRERMNCYRYLDVGYGPEPIMGDLDGAVWSGDEIQEILDEGRAAAVTDLAAVHLAGSPLILSASQDGTARLIGTSDHTRQVASHTTAITRVAVIPEPHRTRLLTASEGGTVRVWDPSAHASKQRHSGHTHAINALVTLTDGRLVSCSADGTLALLNTETGDRQQIQLLHHQDYPVPDDPTGIGVLEGGEYPRILASCAYGGLALWDTSAREEYLDHRAVYEPPGTPALITIIISGVTHVAYASQNGEIMLCSADRVEYLSRWPHQDETDSANVPEEERVLLTLPVGTTCLAASPTHILAGHRSGEVWSAPLQCSPLQQLLTQHTAPVHAVATVELDGQSHVISGDDVGAVQVASFGTSPRLRLDGHTRAVFAITPVLLHGRPHVLTGGLDRSMRLWDVTSGRQLDVLCFPDTVFAISVAQDGTVFVGVGPDIICLAPDNRRFPLRPYTAPDRGRAIK